MDSPSLVQLSPVAPPSATWNVIRQTVSGQPQALQVQNGGHSFEWHSSQKEGLEKLLAQARGEGALAIASHSQEVVSRLNAHQLSYQCYSFNANGILVNIVSRVLPLGVLPLEAQQVIEEFDHAGVEPLALNSPQSLHFKRKTPSQRAAYTVYLSASQTLMNEAQHLFRLLGDFEHDWGLHPILLVPSEEIQTANLAHAMQSADLFLALIDGDYGSVGSRSQTELRLAQELKSVKSKPWITAVIFENPQEQVTEILRLAPTLFLYGKSAKESVERMASFALSLLLRKRAKEQGRVL